MARKLYYTERNEGNIFLSVKEKPSERVACSETGKTLI